MFPWASFYRGRAPTKGSHGTQPCRLDLDLGPVLKATQLAAEAKHEASQYHPGSWSVSPWVFPKANLSLPRAPGPTPATAGAPAHTSPSPHPVGWPAGLPHAQAEQAEWRLFILGLQWSFNCRAPRAPGLKKAIWWSSQNKGFHTDTKWVSAF